MRFDLHSYIYFCKDMAAMTQFYSNVLGLRVGTRKGTPKEEWVELRGDGFRIALHKAGKPGCKDRNRNKVVFRVKDVAAARKYLIDHGARLGKHQQWGALDACDGKDPEGNVFQIAGPPTK